MTRALGFRVKSGYAIAVALGGSIGAPTPIARHIVELSDPEDAHTRQPYHSNVGEAEEDQQKIAKRVKAIERAAAQSIDALVDERDAGACGAALVVGSVIDPATVGNPHIRAHANEGKLFRTVLEDALRQRGLRCSVVVEKQLMTAARTRLKRTEPEIAKQLAVFGKTLGAPWRAEEKAAAIAAWMTLG